MFQMSLPKSVSALALAAMLLSVAGCANRDGVPATSSQVAGSLETGVTHHQSKVQYAIRDLGSLGGSDGAGATAEVISNNGLALGTSNLAGDKTQHGFVWRNGKMIDLGTLGGLNSNEQGVPLSDALGLIAGTAQTNTVDPLKEYWGSFTFYCGNSGACRGYKDLVRGFVWRDGVATALPTFGGNNARAYSINDNSQVVGFAEDKTRDHGCPTPQLLHVDAALWQPGGQRERSQFSIHRLPPMNGDTVAIAAAINDQGLVAGTSGSCSGLLTSSEVHSVLWDDGAVIDMGNLGGSCCNSPVDINSRGQVVGYSAMAGNKTFHAFLWHRGTKMIDLGVLPGYAMSFAFGINDQGVIVGGSCADIYFNGCTAAIWRNGEWTDLNTLIRASAGIHLFFGNDINAGGEIATYAFDPITKEYHAAVAIPCDKNHARDTACQASNRTTTPQIGSRQRSPDPETVLQLFQHRLPFGRFPIATASSTR
jgi:probable HAF family extracellular repeat protein